MKRFTSQNVKVARAAIEKALEPLKESHGLIVDTGRINYDAHSFNVRLDVKLVETEDGKSGEQATFEKYCEMYGFEKNHYGKTVDFSGAQYKFVGFNLRGRKNVILIRDEYGKEAVCNARTMKRKLEQA